MESNSRPKYIQVESTLEFSRLVCALERMPRVSFLHEHKGSKVLSVQIDLLKEKPVIYYTPNSDVGHYLCYGFKSGWYFVPSSLPSFKISGRSFIFIMGEYSLLVSLVFSTIDAYSLPDLKP